jgi:hypothetical protein
VTSTVDRGLSAETRRRTGAGLLGILSLILLGQLITPEPWMYLGPVLPVVGAAALLLSQTALPALGWVPAAGCLAMLFAFGAAEQPWAWCLVAGVLATSLLGRAERQGVAAPRRAWAYLPVIALAATIPLAPGYRELVERIAQAIASEEARQLANWRAVDLKADQRVAIEQVLAMSTAIQLALARNALPALLFAWVMLLVQLAERMARRLADLVRRPLPAGMPFVLWRLPDGVAWLLVLGLGLLATRDPRLVPVGLNTTAAVGLAFGAQGLAVIKWFLTTHGMSPGLVAMLFVFTTLMLGPVVPLAAASLGLLDQWLDFRHLEPRADEAEPEGGNSWK